MMWSPRGTSIGFHCRRGAGSRVQHNWPAIAAAACTGLTIATYTVFDGLGVRCSGSAVGYTVCLMALHGLATMAAVPLARRTRLAAPVAGRAGWPVAAATGVLSMLAYGLVLWAQTRGALAAVAALRESSVVVAAALGAVLFHEPCLSGSHDQWRVRRSLLTSSGHG